MKAAVALRAVVITFTVAAAAVMLQSPARADDVPGCVASRPIGDQVSSSPVVFVGTVVELTDQDREATVNIIRVWRGNPVAPRVVVRGTVATQSKVHTALDRTYAKGATYLFLPTAGSSPRFIENQCSATAPLTRELAALAPTGGGELPAGTTTLGEPGTDYSKVLPLAIGGAAALLLTALLLAARRRGKATAHQSP